jgi:hypothetical protein
MTARQPRRCLRCEQLFPSFGPENSLCKACRAVLNDQSPGPEPHRVNLREHRRGR